MEASSYQFYNVPSSDILHVDDLLNFNNEGVFDSAKETQIFPLESSTEEQTFIGDTSSYASNFTDDLCLPNHDASELEWVSEFMEDSFSTFSEYPLPSITEKGVFPVEEPSAPTKVRSKRIKPSSLNTNWSSSSFSSNHFIESEFSLVKQQSSDRKKDACLEEQFTRKCSHCSAEKTPQWRTGPLGPKTLCNACGVRYKSGRLVPEYRPAASPSFVLTQHSNSHRKVMELRRQKEQLQVQREDMLFDYKVF